LNARDNFWLLREKGIAPWLDKMKKTRKLRGAL
jgi:hypothetical protein